MKLLFLDPRFLLGLALPVLPFFGYGILSWFVLVFCLSYILLRKAKYNKNAICFALLLLLPLSISLIFTLIQEIDLYLLKTILFNAGPLGLFEYIKDNNPVWYRAIFHFLTYINFSLLILVLPADTLSYKNFAKGLAYGVIFSCLVGLAQLFEIHPWFSVNRDPFWLLVGRYEGTFTDPNALGVMAALLLPYFFYLRKFGLALWIAGILLAGFSIFSESRTFWLAMFSWFLIANIKTPKRLVVLVLPSLLLIPSLNGFLQSLSIFNRFDRILQTLNWNTFVESLYSRLLLGEIAVRMWKTSPILGVGIERFLGAQHDVAITAGLALGDWRDNANNFYLQVLSEQGVYGLILFFALVAYVCFLASKQSGKISSILLLILVVIFITGPHLLFEEVKYFVAIIVGDIVLNSQQRFSSYKIIKVLLGVTFILGILLIFVVMPKPRAMLGFWGKEVGEEGEFAWTSAKARLRLCDVPEGQHLDVRSFRFPIELSLLQNNKPSKIILNSAEWQSIELSSAKMLELKLIPSFVWSPSAGQSSGDKRWLGVIVKIPNFMCK